MQRIDRHDDLADHDVMDQYRIGADRLDDRAGVGKAAGLRDDALQPLAVGRCAASLVADCLAAAPSRSARAVQQAQPPASTAIRDDRVEQRIVDRRFRRFVDDDESVAQRPVMQLVAQPRRLARAEEAAQHGQPHAAVGAAGQASSPVADEARVERVERSAGKPFGGSPDFFEVANDGVAAGERRQLDARNLRPVMGGEAVGRQHRLQHLGAAETGAQPIRCSVAAPASVQWPGAAGNPQLAHISTSWDRRAAMLPPRGYMSNVVSVR